MRRTLIAAALLAGASPALAQPPHPDDIPYADDVESVEAPVLPPAAVAEQAQALDRLVGAVMDLPIGGIVAAVDPYGRGAYGRGDTVRDVATRNDPLAEARLRGTIGATAAGVGALSEAMARMAPVLRETAREFERSVGAAVRGYERRLPDYYERD